MHLPPAPSAACPSAAGVLWAAIVAEVSAAMPFGPTLHLPSDSLAFAAARPGMLTTAAAPEPAALCVCTAEALPFPADTFACAVGFDVLGHARHPARMLAEAERILAPGGRLVLMEPWTGAVGRLYHRVHGHRRVVSGLDPWFDSGMANAAAPRACLVENADELHRHAPALVLVEVRPFGGLGEFLATRRRPDATALARHLARLNALPAPLRRLLNGWLATRALCVLEKRGSLEG